MVFPKVDFKKQHDGYQAKRGEFRVLDVPPLRYLMIDGSGDPNTSQSYADALATLYPVAYALKFASKQQLQRDYVVPPLEALWWADDMASFTTARDKSRWSWTVMIMVPEWLSPAHYDAAVAKVAKAAKVAEKASRTAASGSSLTSTWSTWARDHDSVRDDRAGRGRAVRAPSLDSIRLAELAEGQCVQTLHVGPYDAEGPVLEEMHHRFIPEHGLAMTGRHHEIYLGDPRRTAPERLRTILRQPVQAA